MIMIMIMIMVTVHVLSDGENCEILRSLVLSQYQRVTDRRTDRHADFGSQIAQLQWAYRCDDVRRSREDVWCDQQSVTYG